MDTENETKLFEIVEYDENMETKKVKPPPPLVPPKPRKVDSTKPNTNPTPITDSQEKSNKEITEDSSLNINCENQHTDSGKTEFMDVNVGHIATNAPISETNIKYLTTTKIQNNIEQAQISQETIISLETVTHASDTENNTHECGNTEEKFKNNIGTENMKNEKSSELIVSNSKDDVFILENVGSDSIHKHFDLISANKCKTLAEKYIKSGDYDKASNLIEKAKRIHPEVDVKDLINEKQEKNTKINATIHSFKSNERLKDVAKENFEDATKATKEVSIKTSESDNINKSTETAVEDDGTIASSSIKENTRKAFDCEQMAHEAYKNGHFEKAEELILTSNRLHPNTRTYTLLNIIRIKRRLQSDERYIDLLKKAKSDVEPKQEGNHKNLEKLDQEAKRFDLTSHDPNNQINEVHPSLPVVPSKPHEVRYNIFNINATKTTESLLLTTDNNEPYIKNSQNSLSSTSFGTDFENPTINFEIAEYKQTGSNVEDIGSRLSKLRATIQSIKKQTKIVNENPETAPTVEKYDSLKLDDDSNDVAEPVTSNLSPINKYIKHQEQYLSVDETSRLIKSSDITKSYFTEIATAKQLKGGSIVENEDSSVRENSPDAVENNFDKTLENIKETDQQNAFKSINTSPCPSDYETSAVAEFENKQVTTEDENLKLIEAMKYIKKAQNAFDAENLDEAEEFLIKANQLSPHDKINTFLDVVRTKRQQLTDKYINMAEEAISNGSRQKAEEYYFKVIVLDPNVAVKLLIDLTAEKQKGEAKQHINYYNELTEDERKEEAELRINLAKRALQNEDFLKAEKYLNKAEDLYPSEYAKTLLSQIQAQKKNDKKSNVSFNNTTNPSQNFEEAAASTFNINGKQENLEECIKLALKAFDEKNLAIADFYISAAQKLNPDEEIQEYLKDLENNILLNSNPTENEASAPDDELRNLSSEERKAKAQKCIQLAKDAFSIKDLQRAEYLLLKAKKYFPFAEINEYLYEVRQNLSDDEQCTLSSEERKTKSKMYIEQAQEAIDKQDLQKAEYLLLEAKKFYPFAEINEYLYEVRSQNQ